MAYRDFKDSARKTVSDKVLRDKTFSVAKKSRIKWISARNCFNGSQAFLIKHLLILSWVVLLKMKLCRIKN